MKFETIFTTKKFQSLIDATSSSNQFHVLRESSLSLQSFVSFLGQVTFTIHKYVNTWGFCNFHGWRSIQMKQVFFSIESSNLFQDSSRRPKDL
ncbi:uncharacterized protein LOC123918409 isoform X2 [Trifolium pratense]|uniref:uncharacterized protein LOC123918409 isoform X2 n=1 Tax=Trifolium pratense TaxID=57577 RepID=UPI001E696CF9|nr:uncharacterized protein LOC123918409 isoform X2 [Trifolium pratense]